MKGPRSTFSSMWVVFGVLGLAFIVGCSGNNETPASYDPIEIALVRVEPADGESSVPRNRVIRFIFNTTVLPESVHDQSIRVRTGGTFQQRPEGSFLVSGNVVEFDPTVSESGGRNSRGFPAGAQVFVQVPLYVPGADEPENNYVQNVEGNPIVVASGENTITFGTGSGWDDPEPGPPGILSLDFVPGPNAVGQVPARASVTAVFSEPIDPATVVLGKNIFLTNNTETSPLYQQDVPSVTYFDGSLTRYTFQPVFGFGQGPFNMLVNFIDPDKPDTFDPVKLPKDLGGNEVLNFTFYSTFDTQFDPSVASTGVLREDFTSLFQRDPVATDAIWGDDPQFPFALVGQTVTQRTVTIDWNLILAGGASSAVGWCPTVNPLVGPGFPVLPGSPQVSDGRRQLNLYRPWELQGDGTVTRVAWGPDSDATFAATYPDVIIRFGHKRVGTSLATGSLYAQFDVDGYVTAVNKVDYQVPQAADIGNDGILDNNFLNWPSLKSFFDYNGTDGLIMDVEAKAGATWQQFRTFIGVSTAWGTCTCANFFGCAPNSSVGNRQMDSTWGSDYANPADNPVMGILNPGPWVHEMEFDLAKLRSIGQSLYYDTETPVPDYLQPIISPFVQAGGAEVFITWSASHDGLIEDVPFTEAIDDCDGRRFLRYRAEMRSNLLTGARPRVELIEIPFIIVE